MKEEVIELSYIPKRIAFILLSAFMIASSLCGCAVVNVPSATEEPSSTLAWTEISAEAPTALPTEVPTEEPTEEPTEAPTPEPTATPTPEPTLKPIEEFPLPDDPDAIGDCIRDAEVILHLTCGDGENELGYADAGEVDSVQRSPEAFVIKDGKVYILDSLRNRVIVYDDGMLSYIRFPEPEHYYDYYQAMAIVDDRIYACSCEYLIDAIPVFDMTGSLLEMIPLPEKVQKQGVFKLLEENGKLIMFDHYLSCYELIGGEFVEQYVIGVEGVAEPKTTYTIGDDTVEIFTGENSMSSGLRIFGDRVYCYVLTYNPDIPAPHEEMSYRVYDFNGNLLGATVVDRRNVLTYPRNAMFINSDGELYIMCCMQDGVYITKPHLRTEYVSHLDVIIDAGY